MIWTHHRIHEWIDKWVFESEKPNNYCQIKNPTPPKKIDRQRTKDFSGESERRSGGFTPHEKINQ